MEYWSVGVMLRLPPIIPILHHSTTPIPSTSATPRLPPQLQRRLAGSRTGARCAQLLATDQEPEPGDQECRVDENNKKPLRQPVQNLFPDEGAEDHDRSERQPHRDALARQDGAASISDQLGDVHYDCGKRFGSDERAFDKTVRQKEGNQAVRRFLTALKGN